MKWSHEMARTKTRPAAAPSTAHPAPDPAPAPNAAAAPGSPVAAVHAALAASPGATTAVIAGTAAIGKAAARDALLAMEKAGTATRVRGGKPGIPDTWTLTDATPDGAGPAADPEDEQGDQPDDGPAGSSLNGAGDDEAAREAVQDGTTGTAGPGQQDGDAGDGTSAAPDRGTEKPGTHDDAPAGSDREDTVPGQQDDEAVPDSDGPQDPGDGDDPGEEDAAPAGADGEASVPDPALVTEIAGRIAQIKTAADAAATVLAGDGDLRAALTGLDEIAEQAAQARRSLKAALGGRKTPAARPGGLRDKVLAHLDAHPDGQFTPHEIHKVLGNSSGAIANALDTLVKLGEAELATEKPRRFRRAAKSATSPAGAGDAGSAADSTELAGAA
jgi:hypothetical protein